MRGAGGRDWGGKYSHGAARWEISGEQYRLCGGAARAGGEAAIEGQPRGDFWSGRCGAGGRVRRGEGGRGGAGVRAAGEGREGVGARGAWRSFAARGASEGEI